MNSPALKPWRDPGTFATDLPDSAFTCCAPAGGRIDFDGKPGREPGDPNGDLARVAGTRSAATGVASASAGDEADF